MHAMGMAIANPALVPGSTLRTYRELHGVERTEVAKRLGKHRNTLAGWEAAVQVDATRAELFRLAVDAIVRERLESVA